MDLGIDGIGPAVEIGAGGAATIYRARQLALEREVAVKVLKSNDAQFVRRFAREARTLGRLSRHPGIVTVYDTGVNADGRPYLLLELCSASLLDRLRAEKRLEPTDACRYMTAVAVAVAEAHDEGVVHRDLKPGNILLADDGKPLVSDFGISMVADTTFGVTTSVGFTPGYVAPETLNGEGGDKPADVYALGATMFHLVSGRAPFIDQVTDSTNLLALATKIAIEPVPDLRDDTPESLCELIEWAMDKRPDLRPSARELARYLLAYLRGSPLDVPDRPEPELPAWAQPTPDAQPAPETEPGLPRSAAPDTDVAAAKTDAAPVAAGVDDHVGRTGPDPAHLAPVDATPPGPTPVDVAPAGPAPSDAGPSDAGPSDALGPDGWAPPPDGAPSPSRERLATLSPPSTRPLVAVGGLALASAVLVTGLVIWLLAGSGGFGSGDDDISADGTAVDGDGATSAGDSIGVADLTPGEGVTVTAARADWVEGRFHATVVALLLVELGFDVSLSADDEFRPEAVYGPMAEGEISYWAHGWYPGHRTLQIDELGGSDEADEQLVAVGELAPRGGLEGLVVTAEVARAQGITSLDQINDDPELVALFDDDGDGRAEIFGCPDGQVCHDVIDDLIEFNGWSNLEQVSGQYAQSIVSSRARVERGGAVIHYLYTPSGFAGVLRPGEDVTWLSVGDRDNLLDGSTPAGVNYRSVDPVDLGPACTNDPCLLGWSWADIRITANRAFIDDNPSARVLFEEIRFPVGDLNRTNAELGRAPGVADPYNDVRVRAAAERWITQNRQLVDGWLSLARVAS